MKHVWVIDIDDTTLKVVEERPTEEGLRKLAVTYFVSYEASEGTIVIDNEVFLRLESQLGKHDTYILAEKVKLEDHI